MSEDRMQTLWRIWSNEHAGWWRENQNGYTPDCEKAGLYSEATAKQIVFGANRFIDHANEQMLMDREQFDRFCLVVLDVLVDGATPLAAASRREALAPVAQLLGCNKQEFYERVEKLERRRGEYKGMSS